MNTLTYAPRSKPNPVARHPHGWTFATVAALGLLVLPVGACSKNSTSAEVAPVETADDPAVASVNGIKILQSDLALAEDDLGENIHQLDPAQKREQLIAYLTDVILISKEAEKRNLQNDAGLKRREAFMHNKLLMGLMLQTHVKTAATDEE